MYSTSARFSLPARSLSSHLWANYSNIRCHLHRPRTIKGPALCRAHFIPISEDSPARHLPRTFVLKPFGTPHRNVVVDAGVIHLVYALGCPLLQACSDMVVDTRNNILAVSLVAPIRLLYVPPARSLSSHLPLLHPNDGPDTNGVPCPTRLFPACRSYTTSYLSQFVTNMRSLPMAYASTPSHFTSSHFEHARRHLQETRRGIYHFSILCHKTYESLL